MVNQNIKIQFFKLIYINKKMNKNIVYLYDLQL